MGLDILAILEPRFDKQELHGYSAGVFNPGQTKFVAWTYVRLKDIEFNKYSYLLTHSGHSAIGTDFEKKKKYLDDGCYQMKTVGECVGEE